MSRLLNYSHTIMNVIIILFVLFIVLFTILLSENSYAARVVAEKRECATCHIAWMSAFKRDDVTTLIENNPRPLEKTGRQDVVSTERMCFSCHDGFALDSRFLWQDGHNHPVGVKPSDKVQIPTDDGKMIFPLNDDGNIYCGTCHSAHGIEWGDQLSPVFLRAKNIDSSICVKCHVDRKGDIGGLHNHPVLKEIPKETQGLEEVGSMFTADNKVICQSCHRIHAAKDKKLLVKENDRSQLCETCHTDKIKDNDLNGTKHFTHPVNMVPTSATVPKQYLEAGSKFGPNKEVICQTCHQVHLAVSDKLVLLDQDSLEQGICVTCHEDKQGILTNGHNIFESRSTEMVDSNRSAMLGACGACHNIHDGKGPKMWAKELETHGDPTALLCLSCHTTGNLAEDFTIGEYSHPVGAALPTGIEPPMSLPLFTSAGERTKSLKRGLVSCPTCHDVHAKTTSKKTSFFFGSNDKGNDKYLRIGEDDNRLLCKTCHQDKWAISNTKHDIEKSKQSNTHAASLGVCGNCHLVHNGLGPRMWARDNISIQANTTSLCLSCHSSGELAEEKTIGEHSHPVGVSIENTGIRVTKGSWLVDQGGSDKTVPPLLPLYNDKGIKQSGSDIVGCGTCHDPHRWEATRSIDSPYFERIDEEGDSRSSFLRIASSPDGKLCTTCHQTKETINATDHDMRVTAPETLNTLDANVEQTGVCGQCHAVHNANQDLVLWARQPGNGQDAQEMLCRSCHSQGEIAQGKAPKQANHPSYVRAWSNELRLSLDPTLDKIPMYSNSGEQSEIGIISCPTCHNAHQWKARKAEKGSGKNEEGDVFSSFLRLPSTEGFICADCHGLDSIFRYKYFHGSGQKSPL